MTQEEIDRLKVNASNGFFYDENGDQRNIANGGFKSTVTITRPDNTTQYAIGDVIGHSPASNFELQGIGVKNSNMLISNVALEIDINAVPTNMIGFRLHLYSAEPTAIEDNSAFNLVSADRSKYLGNININTPDDLGDTLWSENVVSKQINMPSDSTSLYVILESLGTFTPSSQSIFKIHVNSMIVGV